MTSCKRSWLRVTAIGQLVPKPVDMMPACIKPLLHPVLTENEQYEKLKYLNPVASGLSF